MDARHPAPGRRARLLAIVVLLLLLACDGAEPTTAPEPPDGPTEPPVEPPVESDSVVLRIPIVVHVVHHGEPIGTGYNLSRARIEAQIRSLNDDFRRRGGTRGHNTHPDGADARIEFVLARVDPDGFPTDGIRRVDALAVPNPTPPGSLFDYYAWYGYWDPARYVNVWTMPLSDDLIDVVLGMATGPETDLPGAPLFTPGEPFQAEGILVNAAHFGESDRSSVHHLGRTLTHEMGHYLGLLHTWGDRTCASNDYCDDTPPVAAPVTACTSPPPLACDGRPVMIENYMNYTGDACMNTFTRDQVARMRYVLENSPRRSTLTESAGLGD